MKDNIFSRAILSFIVMYMCTSCVNVTDNTATASRYAKKMIGSFTGENSDSKVFHDSKKFNAPNEHIEFELINNTVEFNVSKNVYQYKYAPNDPSMYKEAKYTWLKNIYFDENKSEIKNTDNALIKKISSYLINNPSTFLLIEGHSDQNGNSAYNLSLGNERSKAVFDALIDSGISETQMSMVSYGKEHTKSDDPVLNRRVEFKFYKARDWTLSQ